MAVHYPQYQIAVQTPYPELWENNPYLYNHQPGQCAIIEVDYGETLKDANKNGRHFLESFAINLGKQLGIKISLPFLRPFIYLSQDEQEDRINIPYALLSAGIKSDFTVKGAGHQTYQEIVDHFRGYVHFVQVGNGADNHKPLEGTINWIGKLTIRQLFYMAYHSCFGIGAESFLHHVYAAFEKPYVCYLGGRCPLSWIAYPTATMLHTIGKLECCESGGCFKRRVVSDGSNHPFNSSLCSLPMKVADEDVAGCMVELGSKAAIDAIEKILTEIEWEKKVDSVDYEKVTN